MAVDKRSARLGVLATVSLLLIGLLGARLWFLQGVKSADYQATVAAAKTREVFVAPERGRIFDAKGRVVADNQRILTVTVDWNVLRKKKNRLALFERLSGPLQTPVDDLMRRYEPCYNLPAPCKKSQLFDSLLPLPLKEDVDESVVNFLKERSEDYPGVDVVEQWKRVYPYAPLASHVIGFMGAINADNLKSYLAQGYKRNERVGQFGVESSMERELHGQWGKRVYEVDASGAIVRELTSERIEPVAGFDIQLSIDLDVQQYAEQALQTELRNRRNLPTDLTQADSAPHNPCDLKTNCKTRVYQHVDATTKKKVDYPEWVQHKAPAGSVVVLNHTNGQIIAMASYPTFDNRWMESGIGIDKYRQLFPSVQADGITPIDPDQSILVNRAVQGNYNLGSSIKPFVAWSALHSGLINANTIWNDEGTYTLQSIKPNDCQQNGGLARCIFKNATSKATQLPAVYGPLTVSDALAVSSDTFFYHLGEQFWQLSENLPGQKSLLKEDLARFGFGSKTGVQLPFEWKGRVPDDAVKKALVDKGVLAKGEVPRLVVGDNVQVAIGQGLMASTPLQLADAYATIANGGFLLQPTIVKAIYAPLTPDATPGVADLKAGVIRQSFDQPSVRDTLEMPANVLGPIRDGLHRVVHGKGVKFGIYHGTTGEILFRGFPVNISGKTGTAQGAATLPWNDSSAFGAYSEQPEMPYTVVSYLEKSGYGSKAAAPVTKCMFLALSGSTPTDPVFASDPLDLNSTVPAPDMNLTDPTCLGISGAVDLGRG
jgi:penicillin-binding protein 2